ncbi:MAG: Fe-S cluster assembly protein SufD [Gammaproteobacteria bacterium]
MNKPAAEKVTLPKVANDGFASLRGKAREAFERQGWPGRRHESYKYSALTRLGRKEWPRAEKAAVSSDLPAPLGTRLAWVNGYPVASPRLDWIKALKDCANPVPLELARLLGHVAPEADPVVALNTALFDHGAWIELADGAATEQPLELTWAADARAAGHAQHGRFALRLGAGSRLVLIERHVGGAGDALRSRVAEIALGEGARLFHIRINDADPGMNLLGYTAVEAQAGADYRCLTLDLGAKLARESYYVHLAGDRTNASLRGLAITDGSRHADSDVVVEHDALFTRSRQFFRGVVDDRSRSVYSGRVIVRPGAQKTNSLQESANLLLSSKAEADARPQLEIYADDVVCNHGAATGAIDEDALFYLQSRGVDATAARRMIAFGFARTVLEDVEDSALHQTLMRLLADDMQAPPEMSE